MLWKYALKNATNITPNLDIKKYLSLLEDVQKISEKYRIIRVEENSITIEEKNDCLAITIYNNTCVSVPRDEMNAIIELIQLDRTIALAIRNNPIISRMEGVIRAAKESNLPLVTPLVEATMKMRGHKVLNRCQICDRFCERVQPIKVKNKVIYYDPKENKFSLTNCSYNPARHHPYVLHFDFDDDIGDPKAPDHFSGDIIMDESGEIIHSPKHGSE